KGNPTVGGQFHYVTKAISGAASAAGPGREQGRLSRCLEAGPGWAERRRGQRQPLASSRPRSLADSIAARNAARTPCFSSSLIALIVVPPGEVTASRSSTACSPESRS